MIAFLLLLGAVSVYGLVAYGQCKFLSVIPDKEVIITATITPCIHNNHQQQTADQVITRVIADLDTDKDGVVEPTEINAEFATNYDKDGNREISEAEFVDQWFHTYHDTHPFAGYLFTNFDMNDDLKLTDTDITAMQLALDTNGDGKLSAAEFRTALTTLYTTCVTSQGR